MIVGESISDLLRSSPAPRSRIVVAVVHPSARAHVPVECCLQVSSGLEMLRDQSGVRIGRSRIAIVQDRSQQPCKYALADLSCDS